MTHHEEGTAFFCPLEGKRLPCELFRCLLILLLFKVHDAREEKSSQGSCNVAAPIVRISVLTLADCLRAIQQASHSRMRSTGRMYLITFRALLLLLSLAPPCCKGASCPKKRSSSGSSSSLLPCSSVHFEMSTAHICILRRVGRQYVCVCVAVFRDRMDKEGVAWVSGRVLLAFGLGLCGSASSMRTQETGGRLALVLLSPF